VSKKKALENYKLGLETLYLFSDSCGKLVHAMGKPVFVNDGKRAYVMLNDENKIVFCLDEPYFSGLDYDEDMAFVLLHEALHVAWNHLREIGMDKYDNKKVLTFAHEVLINDSISKLSGLTLPDMDGPTGTYVTGPEMFNHDFYGMTTQQAYDYILNNAPEDMDLSDAGACEIVISGSGGDLGSGTSDGDGDGLDDLMDAVIKAIQGEFNGDGDEASSIVGVGSDIASEIIGKGTSTSTKGNTSFDAPEIDLEFDFIKLLEQINPDVRNALGGKGIDDYVTDWTAPRHSMRAYYPDIIIPRVKRAGADGDSLDDKSTNLLFATDQSGSIPKKYVDISSNLLTKVPDDIFTPHMALWAGKCVEYVPGQITHDSIGYGTEIMSVYRYARKMYEDGLDPYVVVFTDGDYYWDSTIDVEWIKSRWYFVAYQDSDVNSILSYGSGYTNYPHPVERDNIYKLSDLWKGN